VLDVYFSRARDTEAETLSLTRAVEETGVRPHSATTDKAAIYPPALAALLPEVPHRAGKAEQQATERDHQHLKGRYRSMRGFKQLRCVRRSRLCPEPARWLLPARDRHGRLAYSARPAVDTRLGGDHPAAASRLALLWRVPF